MAVFDVATVTLLLLQLLFVIPSVHPSQEKSSNDNDPFASFDDDFGDDFEEMDKEDRVNSRIDEGFQKWEDRCLEVGGQSALDDWLKAQEDLVYCVMENFDVEEIQNEIELKKETGDLDLVFKKYCGDPVKNTRPCIENFLEASRRCLRTEDRAGLNITLGMIDSAIDFMCHNSGDRIALFMSEDGMGCLLEHQESIMNCVNASVPDLFDIEQTNNMHLIVFSQDNCRKGDAIRHCIETSLLKCDDPTPSNVVNSMLLSMRKATPCRGLSASYTAATATTLSTLGHITIVSLLLMCIVGR